MHFEWSTPYLTFYWLFSLIHPCLAVQLDLCGQACIAGFSCLLEIHIIRCPSMELKFSPLQRSTKFRVLFKKSNLSVYSTFTAQNSLIADLTLSFTSTYSKQ